MQMCDTCWIKICLSVSHFDIWYTYLWYLWSHRNIWVIIFTISLYILYVIKYGIYCSYHEYFCSDHACSFPHFQTKHNLLLKIVKIAIYCNKLTIRTTFFLPHPFLWFGIYNLRISRRVMMVKVAKRTNKTNLLHVHMYLWDLQVYICGLISPRRRQRCRKFPR